jgi:hypothetical protein
MDAGNNIGPKGWASLAPALKKLPQLDREDLDEYYNYHSPPHSPPHSTSDDDGLEEQDSEEEDEEDSEEEA